LAFGDPFSTGRILERHDVHRLVVDDALELTIHLLELTKALGLAGLDSQPPPFSARFNSIPRPKMKASNATDLSRFFGPV
jgi:hypothetical protein